MVNNFYVGIVHHQKRIRKPEYNEKLVLYKLTEIDYLDLENDITYTTIEDSKDYVIKETLLPTDISQYRIDYIYLLSKHIAKNLTKKKKRSKTYY